MKVMTQNLNSQICTWRST